MEVVGDYEYLQSQIIGHGAFAIVFKGRNRIVSTFLFYFIDLNIFSYLW